MGKSSTSVPFFLKYGAGVQLIFFSPNFFSSSLSGQFCTLELWENVYYHRIWLDICNGFVWRPSIFSSIFFRQGWENLQYSSLFSLGQTLYTLPCGRCRVSGAVLRFNKTSTWHNPPHWSLRLLLDFSCLFLKYRASVQLIFLSK
jgi:hypothetical protein